MFVRKIQNISRNIERLASLHSLGYNVPEIIRVNNDQLDMEYIHGLDMTTYLSLNNIDKLKKFLIDTMNRFSNVSEKKDYTSTYHDKLSWMENEKLPFTREDIIDKLPKELPQSVYHGDFTLENIIFKDNIYYMIDPLMSEYDSFVFDLAKLRQDLECKWFLRKKHISFDVKLQGIQDALFEAFPICKDDSLLILMLLRVYPYTKKNSFERKFIMRELNKLWK